MLNNDLYFMHSSSNQEPLVILVYNSFVLAY